VTNYYLPERQMTVQMPISVRIDTDPAVVEQVLMDEIKKRHLTSRASRVKSRHRFSLFLASGHHRWILRFFVM